MKRIIMIGGCCAFFWSFAFCGIGLSAEFHGVSELNTGCFFFKGSSFSIHYIHHAVSKFMALSGDGSTVVSGRLNSQNLCEPYSWTVKGGRKWLGFSEPPQQGHRQSFATAVSYDGSVIAGRTRINEVRLWWGPILTGFYVDEVKGFVWKNNFFTGLPWIPDESYEALPYDITGNGAVVVGDSWEGEVSFDGYVFPWHRAVKWDYGITDLGTDDEADSVAYAVSGDGSVIVGVVGDVDDWWHPAIHKGGGWQRMAILSGATCPVRCNMAVGVSVDGKKAVGHLYDGTKSAPALWDTTSLQPFFLSQLPGKTEGGTAYDVSGLVDIPAFSGKGYIAGGALEGQAVIWKVDQTQQSSSAERVEDVLTSLQLGTQIKGWKLSYVFQVSDDGKTLAGLGINPNGQWWIWYADLDAPPPANDDCDDAQDISVPGSHTQKKQLQGTTRNATHDVYQGCSSGKRLSVWYRFNAPAEGFLALDLCGSNTLQDPALSVFTDCWVGTERACSTGCSGIPCTEPCLLEDALVKVEKGEDYYVMVSSKDGVPGSSFTLNYQFLPINDACTEGFFLAAPSEIPGQTRLATADAVQACQGVNVTAPGVWYKVVGNGHLLTASTCDSMTDFDTQISVYCSGCSTPTCVAANNDDGSCGQKSSVTWCSASGMVYDVFVHGLGSATGNFKLKIIDTGTSCTWSINCHPVNEDCQQAIPLSQGTIMVDNSGTNPLGPIASDCGGYHPIWFTYTTQCDGEVTIDTVQKTLGTLDDTILSIYESCDGPELVCNDDYDFVQFGKRSAVILSSPGGRKYRIRASSYAAYDVGTFPLRVTEVIDPVDIVPWSLPVAGEHAEYVYQLPVSGGCPFSFDGERGLYSIKVDDMPPGMNVDNGGRLWGIPEASGRYSFIVNVGDKDLSTLDDSETYTLQVRAANDKCEDATYINEGLYLFGNQDMDTDGPEEPGLCSTKSPNVYSDLWFRYESLCTGMAKVDLCGSSFDTKVVVYVDDCPRGPSAVYCNDDACIDKSQLEFPVEMARHYLIRVGGAYSNTQGNGELIVTCFNDCNGNGVNDLDDIESGFSLDCNQDGHPDDCIGHEYVCNDDNPCTDDTCTQSGCVFKINDANSCQDGDICNGQERCESGICIPGTPPEPGCCVFDEDDDGDVDGLDLAVFPIHYPLVDLTKFLEEYGRNNCLTP